ncbi:MAG TPA: hypothetical protein P5571_04295 [Candidatus Krumholzibacteria bacterium]|mgnify:CR=1 FL=1|nr:hypothetical protein [Candidatus Krumholzibacteria bacterium]
MSRGAPSTLLLWALRDVARRPGRALVDGAALALLTAFSAGVLLLVQGWSAGVTELVDAGPSLVVRRVDAGGWAPLPADAVELAAHVVGVTSARPRVWGLAAAADGAVTVRAVSRAQAETLAALGLDIPVPGQALVGPGLAALADAPLVLRAAAELELRAGPPLPGDVAPALHDVVLLAPSDARALLGLHPDQISDLAVTVHHAAEESAITADLAAAFPYPVQVTTRAEARGAAVAALTRDGGLVTLMLGPALLGLGLLLTAAVRDAGARRRDLGLLKTLGWSTSDLVRLHLLRAAAVAVPAVLVGGAAAWLAVFTPGITWPGALLLGWRTPPPPWTLPVADAGLALAAVAGAVLTPWLLAAALPAVRAALADPDDLLRGGDA